MPENILSHGKTYANKTDTDQTALHVIRFLLQICICNLEGLVNILIWKILHKKCSHSIANAAQKVHAQTCNICCVEAMYLCGVSTSKKNLYIGLF